MPMYQEVAPTTEIRQGDVFISLPWLLFNPCKIGKGNKQINFAEAGVEETQLVGLYAQACAGVVISADCDCSQNDRLLVCRLYPITVKEPGFPSKSPKNKLETRLKYNRTKIGLYVFPAIGDLVDSYADFGDLLSFTREFLEQYRINRIATLTEEARHHLREKIAHFHTRFGPDERYMFTADELEIVRTEGWL